MLNGKMNPPIASTIDIWAKGHLCWEKIIPTGTNPTTNPRKIQKSVAVHSADEANKPISGLLLRKTAVESLKARPSVTPMAQRIPIEVLTMMVANNQLFQFFMLRMSATTAKVPLTAIPANTLSGKTSAERNGSADAMRQLNLAFFVSQCQSAKLIMTINPIDPQTVEWLYWK